MSASSATPHAPLIGRQARRQRSRAAVDRAALGRGGLVLLSGLAGAGIPAVVATSTATATLRDGELVTVDGDTGTVERLET